VKSSTAIGPSEAISPPRVFGRWPQPLDDAARAEALAPLDEATLADWRLA
jgi:hypothetical protein